MINTTKKYKIQGEFPHVHIGALIKKILKTKGLSHSEVARRIGVKPTTFHAYLFRQSVQVGVLWKISLAINYNIFADLMNDLPESVYKINSTKYDLKQSDKDNEIADLKKEIEIYKNLLVRK